MRQLRLVIRDALSGDGLLLDELVLRLVLLEVPVLLVHLGVEPLGGRIGLLGVVAEVCRDPLTRVSGWAPRRRRTSVREPDRGTPGS